MSQQTAQYPELEALFEALSVRIIGFNPALARVAGSVTAGLMLGQGLYWIKRTRNAEGWVYKTRDEWQEELTLSRAEQETARRLLRGSGFWEECRRGVPPKVYFRVRLDKLCLALAQLATKARNSPISLQTKNHRQETGQSKGRKLANHRQETGQSQAGNQPIITESTQESTQRIQQEKAVVGSAAQAPFPSGWDELTWSEEEQDWVFSLPDASCSTQLAQKGDQDRRTCCDDFLDMDGNPLTPDEIVSADALSGRQTPPEEIATAKALFTAWQQRLPEWWKAARAEAR